MRDGKMINLAGNTNPGYYIRKELHEAGIEAIYTGRSGIEVQSNLGGKLDGWTLRRWWNFWTANAGGSYGMLLEDAIELHDKDYPIKGVNQPRTYGEVIRTYGCPGGDDPRKWAIPQNDKLGPQLRKLKIRLPTDAEVARLCNEGKIIGPRYIGTYTIDTQEALNEFARTIKR
jgi:hypothetical protein